MLSLSQTSVVFVCAAVSFSLEFRLALFFSLVAQTHLSTISNCPFLAMILL